MKLCVLASGSKGNSTYIESNNSKILIDLGMSCLYIEKSLNSIDVRPREIHGILITHTHSDHINGLKVFLKKYNTCLYVTEKIYKELKKQIEIENYILIEDNFKINDINIEIFKTSHDAEDSNGYIISDESSSVAYITDTGYINRKYHKKLQNKDYYVIESNHDIEMLMNGSYPYHLKQRILGDRGHLSNKACADYMVDFIGEKTKGVILIHLSEENNDKSLAYKTFTNTLKDNKKEIEQVIISLQNEPTEVIEI